MASKKRHTKSKKKNTAVIVITIIVILVLVAVLLDRFVIKKKEVAARVNGERIYVDDVESLYAKMQDAEKLYVTKGVLLGLLIDNKLLLQKAQSLGITATAEEVDALVNAYKSYMPEGNFEKQIGSDKAKLKQFREELKENLIIQKFVVSQLPEVNATDEEISTFFGQYSQMFSGDLIRASHILVETEDEAKAILAQLKNGANFSQLAMEKSIDSSSANGGDLGWFGHGATVPEFEEAAYKLNVGEISDIVKTQYGYHILLVTNKTSVKTPVLEEIKPLIRSSMVNQKIKADVTNFMNLLAQLKAESKVEVLNDFEGTYIPESTETSDTLAEPSTTILATGCTQSPGTLIYYYSADTDKSTGMMEMIDTLANTGYKVVKVNKYSENPADIKIISDCYANINLQQVPQVICAGTGEVKVGLIPFEELKQFADACAQ